MREPGSPPPFDPPQFASRVPSRTPNWKTHRTLAHARMAVGAVASWDEEARGSTVLGGEVWQFTGEWVLLATVEPGSLERDLPWR